MSNIHEKVEEEVLSLVGQIEYGDITDLNVYWKSLLDSLKKLGLFVNKSGSRKVSDLLDGLAPKYFSPYLVDITKSMEEISAISSTGSIDEDSLSDLEDLAQEFEREFMELLDRISKDAEC